MPNSNSRASRIKSLEEHLGRENPVLVEAVRRFRELDRIGHKSGLLPKDESYAMRISWWPLVSVLGTFSAGKSSFINYYLGQDLQRTGNQAVDDKFTVICYSNEGESRVLPGVSLDSDMRFPFYRMSTAIDQVAPGEGHRIDTYLQLKTCPSEKLKGKIMIDSPGFDADSQRSTTLRITDHIIDLSDLVLVFFDARHPEPGAMRDTLQHLVAKAIERPDATKFMFILNQMDTTAREDNPEEVVAAWQRAVAEKGLTAGRFYCIYNPSMCVPIEDDSLRTRYEARRDKDLAEIYANIEDVDVGRSYRIVGSLEKTAAMLGEAVTGRLTGALGSWRKLVWIIEGSLLAVALVVFAWYTIHKEYWDGVKFAPPWWDDFTGDRYLFWGVLGGLVLLILFVHFRVRRTCARYVRKKLSAESTESGWAGDVQAAFDKSTRPTRSLLFKRPAGWSSANEARVRNLAEGNSELVQKLNDHHARPAG